MRAMETAHPVSRSAALRSIAAAGARRRARGGFEALGPRRTARDRGRVHAPARADRRESGNRHGCGLGSLGIPRLPGNWREAVLPSALCSRSRQLCWRARFWRVRSRKMASTRRWTAVSGSNPWRAAARARCGQLLNSSPGWHACLWRLSKRSIVHRRDGRAALTPCRGRWRVSRCDKPLTSSRNRRAIGGWSTTVSRSSGPPVRGSLAVASSTGLCRPFV